MKLRGLLILGFPVIMLIVAIIAIELEIESQAHTLFAMLYPLYVGIVLLTY